MQRRVTIGEDARNRDGLARLTFGEMQALRERAQQSNRSYENQCYRASGLDLMVAAITLWTTVSGAGDCRLTAAARD